MGTRYDFELTVNLKEDVPENVVQIITFLMVPGVEPPVDVPADPFFSHDWQKYPFASWAKSCDPNAGEAMCSFRRVLRYTQHGIDHYQHTLHLRLCCRAESLYEDGLSFAMWLAKWSDQNECVGQFKGEGSRHPTLLYFHAGELYLSEVSAAPQRATDGAPWK
jgi:hypothetical protein